MTQTNISIFGDEIFSEIINELKLFNKYKFNFYNNLDLCIKDVVSHNKLLILFKHDLKKNDCKKLNGQDFPVIIITKSVTLKKLLPNGFIDFLSIPFYVNDLEDKITSLTAKYNFRKSSLINLHGYVVDKYERKIKKNNLELQLTEKEINFLILFSQNNTPLSRHYLLEKVWHYSSETDTHTVETHVHRLRKKIFNKFKDDKFIKNNNKGYYI